MLKYILILLICAFTWAKDPPITKFKKKPCECHIVNKRGKTIRRKPTNKIYFIVKDGKLIKRINVRNL